MHIATEGPLGVAARSWCRRRALAFTTALVEHFGGRIELVNWAEEVAARRGRDRVPVALPAPVALAA